MENVSELKESGYLVIDKLFDHEKCSKILSWIEDYREQYTVQKVYRPMKERSLFYYVINGEQVEQNLPRIWQIYQDINQFVNQVSQQELTPLSSKLATVNVNIVPPGGEYRWHYDRNMVTALLFLNNFAAGEIEFYPNYRILVKNQKIVFLQKYLDAILKNKLLRDLFGKKVSIKPCLGMIIIMRGNKCLHSVKPVEGDRERINLVLSYDSPQAQFPVEQNLNSYLYTTEKPTSSDPNYL
ncbi:MAG: 2OG-Fe(II) oxygenase [Waterburya sp.]